MPTIGGEGVLYGAILGLVPVADARGTPEIARGDLGRWLSEAVWYPTALLPGKGLVWSPLDDRSARATLTEGATSVALNVHFHRNGLVERVDGVRDRVVGGVSTATPWRGRVGNWIESNGMRVPIEGEVASIIDGRERPYGKGTVIDVAFEWAGASFR